MLQKVRLNIIILVLLPFLCPASAFGQKKSAKGHEITLILGTFSKISPLPENGVASSWELQAAGGLRYAFRLSPNDALRLTLQRMESDLNQGVERNYTQKNKDLRLGYERGILSGPIYLYGGVEGIYSLAQISVLDEAAPNVAVDIYENYSQLGGALFAGVKSFISPNFSLGLEINTAYLRSLDDKRSIISANRMVLAANLLAGFHFGKLPKRCSCPKFKFAH